MQIRWRNFYVFVRVFGMMITAVALMIFDLGCGEKQNPELQIDEILYVDVPAVPGSGEPNLFASGNGEILLSWLEPLSGEAYQLKFSRWASGFWGQPLTIASGNDWFINWADFPSVVAISGGRMAAHWLQKSGESPYAYDIRLSFSPDSGKSWMAPLKPHSDETNTEHGFVSMLPLTDGKLLVAWLDGRKYAEDKETGSPSPKEMMLRAALFHNPGTKIREWVIDERTCDCCQTSLAAIPGGAILVYRDRSEDEIRDIYLAKFNAQQNTWSSPRRLYADNWKIAGCPVNGPVVDARGNLVAVAWFTAANQQPQVKVVFSEDGGNTFAPPIMVDEGTPLGRVDVAILDNGSALISWMETSEENAHILIRKVFANGQRSASRVIATTSPERASGFPRMVSVGKKVFITWRNLQPQPHIKSAVLIFRPAI